ncbi:MAG: hypothetical protein ACK5FE_12310 [Cyanobacteriota bacterium]
MVLNLLFSALGTGYFVYGRKQQGMVPLLSGIALLAFPLVLHGTVPLLVLGSLIAALPFLLRF